MAFQKISVAFSGLLLCLGFSLPASYAQALKPIAPNAPQQSNAQMNSAQMNSAQMNSAQMTNVQSNAHSVTGQQNVASPSNSAAVNPDNSPYTMTARYHLQQGNTEGYLVLQFDLPKGNYVYSLTQGGTLSPSKISVTPMAGLKLKGKFNADKPPTIIAKDPVFQERLEKHKGTVQFFVPIEVSANVDVANFSPEIIFNGQVCSDKNFCMPIRNKSIRAKFAGYFASSKNQRTSQKQDSSPNRTNRSR